MSTKPTHIFESGLGGDWADEDPTPQKTEVKKGWGAPKKEEAPAVDLRKIQQEERKDKPAPKPQVYQRPQREESDTYQRPQRNDDYPQRDNYQRRDNYDSRPRDDYGGPPRDYQRRDNYDSRPRDDYGGPPRDYQRRDNYDSRPRDDYGGPPRRDYDHERQPREELPVPENPPFIARLGNLNYDMTDEYFHDFFFDLGIVSATIIRDQKTGRSKGFGFVEFTTKEGLENALSCNGSEDLFMDRPFQVSVHGGKKEQSRYGFGPRDGEEPKSFRRDPDKPFEPAGRSYYGNDNRNERYGNNFGKGFGREDNRSFGDRPTGPPSLNLKPRTEAAAAPRDPSPKKPSKLSEDPFGGVTAPDEDKIKRIQEEREKREQEKAQKQKEELERIKANQEKERQDRLAKIEAEKKAREEKQNQSWKGSNTGKTGGSGGWGDKTVKDTSWGPKPGSAPTENKWGDRKASNQESTHQPSEPGIGRGRGHSGPKDNHEGGGRGRGDRKPQGGGRGRGDSNQKGPGPNKSNPKKNQQTTEASAEGGEGYQTPAKQAPASYKAALGGAGATTTDKKATENPFAALHQGQADEEQED